MALALPSPRAFFSPTSRGKFLDLRPDRVGIYTIPILQMGPTLPNKREREDALTHTFVSTVDSYRYR